MPQTFESLHSENVLVFFDLRSTADGITPVTNQADGQVQIAFEDGAFDDLTGCVLISQGGPYYAALVNVANLVSRESLSGTSDLVGVVIRSRYVASGVIDTPGTSVRFVSYDPSIVAYQNGQMDLINAPNATAVAAIKSGLMLANDANVAAIKVVTDKFTFTGSLVNATIDQPLVIVPPLTAVVKTVDTASTVGGVTRHIRLFENSRPMLTWTITDGNGDPLDLTGDSFAFVIHDSAGAIIKSIDSSQITLSASDGDAPTVLNVIGVQFEDGDLVDVGNHQHKLWNLTLDTVHSSGEFDIMHAPQPA